MGGIKAFEEFTFERFQRSSAPVAFDAALCFHPDRSNLYFWGPSGVGKTHLSTAIAHRAWDGRRTVHFAVIPDFKEKLRLFENHYDYDAKKRYVQRCIEADVLVIQELGRGTVSEMVQEALWTILDRRLLDRRNGLVITSNFPLEKIGEKYGGTISRRIEEMCGTNGMVRFPDRPRAQAVNG
jgi:DNA replication protein DnaC